MKEFEIITDSMVNIRQGPGTSYELYVTSPKGIKFKIVSVEPDATGINWYKTEQGGYICSKFCSIVKNESKSKRLKSSELSDNKMRLFNITDNSIVTGAISALATGASNFLSSSLDSLIGQSEDLTLNDRINRRIYGTPYQFLPTTDIRPNTNTHVGRMFASKILHEAPILSILPCRPNYLPSLNNEEKNQFTQAIFNQISSATTDLMKSMSQSVVDSVETKYFTTDIDFVEYMKYVNLMCRGAALWMGLGNKNVPGTPISYVEFNWADWSINNSFNNTGATTRTQERTVFNEIKDRVNGAIDKARDAINDWMGTQTSSIQESISTFLKPLDTSMYYVDFYVSPSTSYSESFSNSTENSTFANALNKGSDIVKEMAFAMGANAIDSAALQESMANISESVRNDLNRINGSSDNLFSRLIMDAQTIISGSNIVFPQIWHNSERNQSYRAEIKLVSPYGGRESIFLNILVPLFHLLAFVLPRQTGANSYGAPFIVKAHMSKWFSCEMGIVNSLDIQKGGWTYDGFPTEVTVSISIQDLYSSLAMSKIDDLKSAYRFAVNQSLLEYLAVNCGLELKKSEFKLKVDLIRALMNNMPVDFVDNTFDKGKENAVNAIAHVLGSFGGGRAM